MTVSNEAVEAADRAITEACGYSEGAAHLARLALEAAAPHMLAEAWDKGIDWAWDGGPDMHEDNPYRPAP